MGHKHKKKKNLTEKKRKFGIDRDSPDSLIRASVKDGGQTIKNIIAALEVEIDLYKTRITNYQIILHAKKIEALKLRLWLCIFKIKLLWRKQYDKK